MRCDDVVIEELVLRVPGIGRDEAPALVRAILLRVQQNLRGSGRVGHHEIAELKLKLPPNVHRAELVDAIAKELTEALR